MRIGDIITYAAQSLKNRNVAYRLDRIFKNAPDVRYDDGDMERVKALYISRKEETGGFVVDDITWNDLSMDQVYKRINNTLSTPGEQYLYHMLRRPAMDEREFSARREAVRLFSETPEIRRNVQRHLWTLGKNRNLRNADIFSPPKIDEVWPAIAIALVALLILSIAAVIANPALYPLLVMLLVIHPIFQSYMMGRIELSPVNYSVAMIAAARRIKRQSGDLLTGIAAPMFESLGRTRFVARLGGVSFAANADLATFINVYLHLDLFMYVGLRHQLHRHRDDIAIIHEYLGRLDASIAIASYRQNADCFTVPAIDFAEDAEPSLFIRGMIHPLIAGAVPNDIAMKRAILLTGSNASGKSTYLKAVAINALLSQGIATALASSFESTRFRVYTSMAISDDVLRGASYFIAEIQSLKRILDAVSRGEIVLCAIDEVLRGTNTLERVAASCELLRALNRQNCLPIAATHDQELCAMLSPDFELFHFAEKIEKNEIGFDYRLKEGPATTKNAVALLEIMGFDGEIIKNSHDRIAEYEKSGKWSKQ